MDTETPIHSPKKKKGLNGLAATGLTIFVIFTLLGGGRPECSTMSEIGCAVGGGFAKGLADIAAFGLLLFAIGVFRGAKEINWTGPFMRTLLLAGVPLSLLAWLPAMSGDDGELLALQIGLAALCCAFYVLETRPCPQHLKAGETFGMCWKDRPGRPPQWHSRLQGYDPAVQDDPDDFR